MNIAEVDRIVERTKLTGRRDELSRLIAKLDDGVTIDKNYLRHRRQGVISKIKHHDEKVGAK